MNNQSNLRKNTSYKNNKSKFLANYANIENNLIVASNEDNEEILESLLTKICVMNMEIIRLNQANKKIKIYQNKILSLEFELNGYKNNKEAIKANEQLYRDNEKLLSMVKEYEIKYDNLEALKIKYDKLFKVNIELEDKYEQVKLELNNRNIIDDNEFKELKRKYKYSKSENIELNNKINNLKNANIELEDINRNISNKHTELLNSIKKDCSDIEEFKEYVGNLTLKVKELEQQNDFLTNKLTNNDILIKNLNQEIIIAKSSSMINEKNNYISEKLKNKKESEINDLNLNIKTLISEKDQLLNKISKIKEKKNKLKQALSLNNDNIVKLENKLNDYDNLLLKVQFLKSEILSKDDIINKLKEEKINNIGNDRTQLLNEQIENLKNNNNIILKEKEEINNYYTKELSYLKENYNTIENKLKEKDNETEILLNKLKLLEQESNSYISKIELLSNEILTLKNESNIESDKNKSIINKYINNIDQLTLEVKQLTNKLEDNELYSNKVISELNIKLETLSKDNIKNESLLMKEISNLKIENENLKLSNSKLRDRVTGSTSELDFKIKRLNEIEKNSDNLKEKNKLLISELQTLKQELKKSIIQHEDIKLELLNKDNDLKKEINNNKDLKNEIILLEKNFNSINNEKNKFEKELKNMENISNNEKLKIEKEYKSIIESLKEKILLLEDISKEDIIKSKNEQDNYLNKIKEMNKTIEEYKNMIKKFSYKM